MPGSKSASSRSKQPELFLSYHRPDLPEVLAVQKLLEAQGIATFLDVRDLPDGLPWPQRLEEALGRACAVAVFFGPTGLGDWQKLEIGFALDRMVREGTFPVIPVLLQGARPEPSLLTSNNNRVDLRDDPASQEGIRRLVETVRGRKLAPRAEIWTDFCPFLGLRAFAEENAPFFCGRKKFTYDLLQMILARDLDLVAVVGASGSGKSSVIRAGLLPVLRRQRPSADTWGVISLTPTDEPFHKLATSVLPLLEPEWTEPKRLAEARKLAEDLRVGNVPLKDVVNSVLTKSHGTDRLLIIVDQFEELFTLTPEEQRRPFVDMLLQASTQKRCSLLLSLRGEFYGHAVALSSELSNGLQRGVINVGPMTREELKQTIEGPAKLVGLEFKAGLVTRILDDAYGQPGHLPLLEFALTELWKGRDGNVLTYDCYEAIGQVVGAIAIKAEGIYNAIDFDKERQEITRLLFTQLVRVARPDEGRFDTRRRALLSRLGPWAKSALGDKVIHRWADERLIAITGQGEELGVELAHEALLREWPRLADWINSEREDLFTGRWLADEAAAWEENRRDQSYLLTGAKLDRAQSWSKGDDKELDFDPEFLRQSELAEQRRREEAQALLDAKTDLAEEQTLRYEEERQHTRKLTLSRRRLRQALGALVAAFLAVAGLAFFVNTLRNQEKRARLEVTWRNLLLGSAAQLGSRPETSLLLALEALRLTSEQPELSASEAEESLRQALAKAAGKPLGHDEIQAIGISPDHRWLATAGQDGTVMVWDLAAADPAKKPTILKSQEGRVSKIAVSSEGRFVAIYTQDDQDQAQDAVRVWNLPEKARDPSWVLQGEDWLGATPFSPVGRWLVTRKNNLVVRDLSHGAQPVGELAGTPTALAFDPQAPRLATGESSGDVILWDLSFRTALRRLTAPGGETRALAFSPDGRWLVSSNADGSVTGWHGLEKESATAPLAFGKFGGTLDSLVIDPRGTRLLGWGGSAVCLWELKTPPSFVTGFSGLAYTAASFNRDGSEVFLAEQGAVLRLELSAVEVRHRLWEREGPPITLLAATDRRWLVVGGTGLVPRLFDIQRADPGDSDEPRTLRTPGAPFTTIALSPDGGSLAAGQENGKILLRDLKRQNTGLVSLSQQEPVTALAFSPDRRFLASGGKGGGILLHDLASPQPLAHRKHPESVTALALSPGSRWLVAGGEGGSLLDWKLPSTIPMEGLINHPGGVTSVTFSRDGRWLATAGADGKARVWLWPLPSQARPTVLEPRKGRIMALAFSPDGQSLATGCADGTTQLWDLTQTSPTPTTLLARHNLDVIALAFSPDGLKLASGSRDRTVRLWNLRPQGAISQPTLLQGHEDEVRAVAFSPDGHWLVSADASGTVRRWNLHLDELKKLACEKAGRNLTRNEWQEFFGTEAYHPTCPEWSSEQ